MFVCLLENLPFSHINNIFIYMCMYIRIFIFLWEKLDKKSGKATHSCWFNDLKGNLIEQIKRKGNAVKTQTSLNEKIIKINIFFFSFVFYLFFEYKIQNSRIIFCSAYNTRKSCRFLKIHWVIFVVVFFFFFLFFVGAVVSGHFQNNQLWCPLKTEVLSSHVLHHSLPQATLAAFLALYLCKLHNEIHRNLRDPRIHGDFSTFSQGFPTFLGFFQLSSSFFFSQVSSPFFCIFLLSFFSDFPRLSVPCFLLTLSRLSSPFSLVFSQLSSSLISPFCFSRLLLSFSSFSLDSFSAFFSVFYFTCRLSINSQRPFNPFLLTFHTKTFFS